MKLIPVVLAALLLSVPGVSVGGASAQVKPLHSGKLSHNAPRLHRHHSGLHRPNRPHYHHHYGFAGYRPVYPHHLRHELHHHHHHHHLHHEFF